MKNVQFEVGQKYSSQLHVLYGSYQRLQLLDVQQSLKYFLLLLYVKTSMRQFLDAILPGQQFVFQKPLFHCQEVGFSKFGKPLMKVSLNLQAKRIHDLYSFIPGQLVHSFPFPCICFIPSLPSCLANSWSSSLLRAGSDLTNT